MVNEVEFLWVITDVSAELGCISSDSLWNNDVLDALQTGPCETVYNQFWE